MTDIEILRLHYARTLREWAKRFAANRDTAKAMYDERFCRMWEFYLASAEMMFADGPQQVFQMQITKRIDAAPIVRDYMVERAAGTANDGQAGLAPQEDGTERRPNRCS